MNLQQIKDTLGIPALSLNTAKDKDDKPTDWMRHWDNDRRIAVSIHKDTVQSLQKGEELNLGLQTEEREGAKGKYTAKRIVAYTPAEVTL
jgi:hypothetical protein